MNTTVESAVLDSPSSEDNTGTRAACVLCCELVQQPSQSAHSSSACARLVNCRHSLQILEILAGRSPNNSATSPSRLRGTDQQ